MQVGALLVTKVLPFHLLLSQSGFRRELFSPAALEALCLPSKPQMMSTIEVVVGKTATSN